MNFWHLIFMAFLANYYLMRKQTTECVHLLSKCDGKMRPSFEEIFGKGWGDEGKEQQQKMDDNNNKPTQKNNWQNGEGKDGIDQMDDNETENQQRISDQRKRKDRSGEGKGGIDKNDQMGDNETKNQPKISDQRKIKDRSDLEKMELVKKFDLIKIQLREMGKFPNIKRAKIEQQIGRQLGTNRKKIYQWKKEFGMKIKPKQHYYVEKKREFIERLEDKFKRMLKEGKEQKVAKELGISERTLREWRKELGIGKMSSSRCFSEGEKRELIEQFDLIRVKLREIGKFSRKIRAKIEQQIGRQLGISRDRIYQWKKEMCPQRMNKCYSVEQKRKIIQKFDLIKKKKLKENWKRSNKKRGQIERQIGRQLGSNRHNIYHWKKELREGGERKRKRES